MKLKLKKLSIKKNEELKILKSDLEKKDKILRQDPQIKKELLEYYSYYVELATEAMRIRNKILNPKTNTEKILRLFYELSPMKVINKSKIRIGRNKDGGYIMIDDFETKEPKIAYSFGIGREISWDKDMAKRGYDIYMYDHTIKGIKSSNPKFHWEKIGICSNSTRKKRLKTLEELIMKNGHDKNKHMILKIDAEGPEEDVVLESAEETLKKFDQIILEFHHFSKLNSSKRLYNKLNKAYKKLNKTHQVIHIHANNACGLSIFGGVAIPKVIEVSFVLKEKYQFKYDFSFYPNKNIDFLNTPKKDEIILGFLGLLQVRLKKN